MATYDNGLAAACYGPCKVTAQVTGRVPVVITGKTNFPFNETVEISVQPARAAACPLEFRIPRPTRPRGRQRRAFRTILHARWGCRQPGDKGTKALVDAVFQAVLK